MGSQVEQRLIPQALADALAEKPDRTWVSYAISNDIAQDGFRDITIRQLATAVDRLAWYIDDNIGKSSDFDTVMYYGLADVRYIITLIAGIKTGHSVLFCSHFNSQVFNLHLCEKTNCHTVMRTEGVEAVINSLVQERPMKIFQVPSLDTLLEEGNPPKPYPYTKSWREACDDPISIGHSSGTTGLPKPIVWTNRSYSVCELHQVVPDLDGHPPYAKLLLQSTSVYQTQPIYHPFGLFTGVTDPLYREKKMVLGPIVSGPTPPAILEQVIEHADIDSLSGVPIYLEMIAKSPKLLDLVEKKLKYIFFAGGALSKPAGDALSARVRLQSFYGATEAGPAFGHIPAREDWAWLLLNDKESGLKWEPREVKGTDGVYELVYVKNPYTEKRQHVWWHTNSQDVHHSNDLFTKHPTKAHHWKFYSRADDMIVTKFGWNVNPVVMEREIERHPAVKYAVVGGIGKRTVCAVIQLVDDESVLPDDPLQSILPMIERGNTIMDAAGQLAEEKIIVGTKDKPFPLAGKGNVQRSAVLKLYEPEIEDMYVRVGD
ncbi:Non-canonical non-ribosomal peptide synthetase FUB8 [Colletotrichum sp. SAR11_59]|nr:Non-canonical non-ribosomal peptide synthetase FUB8 [Colletotrichum sp. SAR11_59]